MEFRSDLGRVRGLGSTWMGVHHFWMQRLTGIALIPLIIWFVFAATSLAGADLATLMEWVGRHYNPVLLSLLIIAIYHHGQLGLQVVIEDYVHNEAVKTTTIILIKLGAFLLAASTVFAVLRLTFGS